MTQHTQERKLDNFFKASFFLLLAVCTFFIRDVHADFKAAVLRIEKLEIEVVATKVETMNTNKQLDRVESALENLSKKLDN